MVLSSILILFMVTVRSSCEINFNLEETFDRNKRATCTDEDPLCTKDKCDRYPGQYLPKCRKTCDNCDCSKCYDTKATPCKDIKGRGLCTKGDGFKNQCPLTCGICDTEVKKNCAIYIVATTSSTSTASTTKTTTVSTMSTMTSTTSTPTTLKTTPPTTTTTPTTTTATPTTTTTTTPTTTTATPTTTTSTTTTTTPTTTTISTTTKTTPTITTTTTQPTTKTTSTITTTTPTTRTTTANITTLSTTTSACANKNESFCTLKNFQLNPYDSFIQCRAFTNNCDGCRCEDSRYPYGTGGVCKGNPQNWCTEVKSGVVWRKCPLKCNKCSEILASGCPTCVDTIPDCNIKKCDQIPGTYYPKCKKTCNNCDGCTCVDTYYDNCGSYPGTGKCAEPQGLKCPVRCNLCDKVRASANVTNCPEWKTCVDDFYYFPDVKLECRQEYCDNQPGQFLLKCRRTCNNCDGCKCYNSLSPSVNCDKFQSEGSCTNKDQLTNALYTCPATCGMCKNITTEGCASAKGRKRRSICDKADDIDCPVSATMCKTKPGLYLNKCPNLCNNCDGLKCFDANSYNCSYYKSNNLCHRPEYNEITYTYCPKTCGFCGRRSNNDSNETGLFTKIKKSWTYLKSWVLIFSPNKPDDNCHDENDCTDVTTDDCDDRPGWFLQKCKKTCGSCESSKCYNSKSYNCSIYTPSDCSKKIKLFEYCPKLCGLCVK